MTTQPPPMLANYKLKFTVIRRDKDEPPYVVYLWFSAPEIPPCNLQTDAFEVLSGIEDLLEQLRVKLLMCGFELPTLFPQDEQ